MVMAMCVPLQQVYADLLIPGISGVIGVQGSDGDLLPTDNITIDLSLAKDGNWDSPGDGNGVYDRSKWAVVFKYNSIDIPTGTTVTFTNHPSGAPVVWLVTGPVDIVGSVQLNGQTGVASIRWPTTPGPGGFPGGTGRYSTMLSGSGGYGPGGGRSNHDDHGSYATTGGGNVPGHKYGHPRILPLIGGSGGSGESGRAYSGGAGGGALLIVCSQTINNAGSIQARGGSRAGSAGTGSGGAIRLIADTISGGGSIYADSLYVGGLGRIRLETLNYTGSHFTVPEVAINAPDDPIQIWLPEAAPTVRVQSVGNQAIAADADVIGSPLTGSTDYQLDNQALVNIVLEARNVTQDATVRVRIVKLYGVPLEVTALYSSGTDALSTWTANDVNLPLGTFTIQAQAINPIQ